jgi:signal transduction histidine kinase
MTDDVSNKTIVVLVLLTVIISVLGTAIVLNEINSADLKSKPLSDSYVKTNNDNQGQVKLTILPEKQATGATGQVVLEIV